MKPKETEYVRYRVARAGETLEEAKLLIENGRLYGAVNRLYYACFHMVSALLFTEGRSSTKHSGIRSLFDQYWVKTGRFPQEMGRFFHLLFKHRHRSDYGDHVTFDQQAVEAWFHEAAVFVAEVSKQIETQLED